MKWKISIELDVEAYTEIEALDIFLDRIIDGDFEKNDLEVEPD